ncbi:MAG: 30S ribosomal protein S3 [Candidatus Woesearchaeota archaeon]|nr:30S ribosomal protein S3 [Candidatus Woesearchaeota archaeon]
MIERKIINDRIKEFQIQEFIGQNLSKVGHSHTKMVRTPLGEKIIIFASRPGLIVGKKGANIKKLTKNLKKKFNLENPQIEISEVENIFLDPQIVAERIANALEVFGANKFKAVGHKTMMEVMGAGALGIEILISGKLPSARAKRWRFYMGYLKKCGDAAISGIKKAYAQAQLKSGIIGVQVRIMPPDMVLPDKIKFRVLSEEAEAGEKKAEEKSEMKETEAGAEKIQEQKTAEPKKPRGRKKKPQNGDGSGNAKDFQESQEEKPKVENEI